MQPLTRWQRDTASEVTGRRPVSGAVCGRVDCLRPHSPAAVLTRLPKSAVLYTLIGRMLHSKRAIGESQTVCYSSNGDV